MIIKKFNGTSWVAQSVRVNSADIVTDVTAGSPTYLFVSGKLQPQFLPSVVFDSLFYYGSTTAAVSTSGSRTILAAALIQAKLDADTAGRNVKGYYFVVSTAGTISGVTSIVDTINSNGTATLTFRNPEGTATGSSDSSGALEVGDWFIIEDVSVAGSTYTFTASVINNTYELATGTVPGISKLGSSTTQSTAANAVTSTASRTYAIQTNSSDQLVVNIPWTDTVYTHPNHSGDVTSVGDGATTIAANAVTNTKLADMAVNTIKGRITAGTGDPEDLTAAQVRTIINVADGANNYVHPTYTYSTPTADTQTTLNSIQLISTLTQTNGHVTGGTARKLVAGANTTITAASDGNITIASSDTTYSAGTGITFSGTVISHTDTSSAANLTASSRTYVSGLTFDTFGHVTGYTTATETVVDTNTTYSAGSGISLAGTTFSVAAGEGLTQEASGLKMTYPVYWHASTLPTSGVTNGSIGFEG